MPQSQHNDFIQLDHYGQFPFTTLPRAYNAAVSKFSRRTLETYGVLPWQIGLYSKKLTDAFRARNWDDAKHSAAMLAHYVAAAHDPFNTTMNSDGKLSNQPGVNYRFNSGLVDRYQLFFFVKPNEAVFIHDPTDHAFEMTMSAHSWLENVLLVGSARPRGLDQLRRRVLRPLLRPGRGRSHPTALRRLHRSRLLLDDGVDQRRPSAIAVAIERSLMTPTPRKPTIVDALPKAELHLHLEGSIRPETAVELAARHDVKISAEEVAKRYNYSDFLGFIETFKWVTSFLRDPDDYRLIVQRLCEELIRQNVVYAEIHDFHRRHAPPHAKRGSEFRSDGRDREQRSIPQAAHRLDLRHRPPVGRRRSHGSRALVREAAKGRRNRLRHGRRRTRLPHREFPPRLRPRAQRGPAHRLPRRRNRRPGLVREAIEILGAERIGHGIAVMNDPELAKSLAMRKVVLENCPTSNICTGALAKQIGKPVATLADHPLKSFVDRGVPVTLSTDDPGMFHTDLLTEYSVAASLGLSNPQLLQLAEQSFNSAFLTPEEKRRYLDDFHAAAKSGGLV